MKLAERCLSEFESQDWRRGAEYHSSGSVVIQTRRRSRIEADVDGSRGTPYEVILDWTDAGNGVIEATCDCPRYDDGYVCKHIAAVIREVDAIGLGAKIPGPRKLRIDPVEEGNSTIELDDDFGPPSFAAKAKEILREVLGIDRKPAARLEWSRQKKKPTSRPRPLPVWKQQLDELRRLQSSPSSGAAHLGVGLQKERQLWFHLDPVESGKRGAPFIAFYQRLIKSDGTPGKLTPAKILRNESQFADTAGDRELLGMLLGGQQASPAYGYYSHYSYRADEYIGAEITAALQETVLRRLATSGRLGVLTVNDRDETDLQPLSWDDGPPWQFQLSARTADDRKHYHIQACLVRGEERRPFAESLSALPSGIIVFPGVLARYDARGVTGWPELLHRVGELKVPIKEAAELAVQLRATPRASFAELPEALDFQERIAPPTPRLTVKPSPAAARSTDLICGLSFRYDDWEVGDADATAGHWREEERTMARRDRDAEHSAAQMLKKLGVRQERRYDARYQQVTVRVVAPKRLPALVAQLTEAGWTVEAEGKLIRRPGELRIDVASGVDWFDLSATCDFEGVSASLPQLLAALRRGEQLVTLDDGTQGILPAEWLKKFAPLAELGKTEDEKLRFIPAQAALLDALLAAQDSQLVSFDETFARLRDRLRSFDGVAPSSAPKSFQGELRPYQRDGLGWLHFLREFHFGGCLADDMGLGKTIQVLALLEQRRLAKTAGELSQPSLVVAPRSLVFNWIEEARRFTPKLRVLNYTGLERKQCFEQIADVELIVTTYGTLRKDIAKLRDFRFDYAILDEAQAIKNASSQAAKACRLLKADHRLAMTGTPVENHLGELWSLLDFLNPGIVGASGRLADLFVNGRTSRSNDAVHEDRNASAQLLGRALRPFLLRRTKQQVLKDLPEKTEQTLHCELAPKERKQYNELREHYRQSLTAKIAKSGVARSKIHVLEALLRLRQAACHPGLLDPKRAKDSSSKLETLLEQLEEVLAEGHKALVFSQFTSLLSIVRHQLDARKIVYEYLDGKTRDRQARVERFQTDEACPLFLISLKAGGQGLNLTAADYVFILDPWWNPAVEAQAVDRAHRLGQRRPVTAYRLIARDTVEEKILQLQAKKRDLADAIINADNSVLGNLTAEDLQLLLS